MRLATLMGPSTWTRVTVGMEHSLNHVLASGTSGIMFLTLVKCEQCLWALPESPVRGSYTLAISLLVIEANVFPSK